MSAEVIKLVSGDDKPFLVLTLTDEVMGTPYDLNGADVYVQFRAAGSTDTPTTIQCTLIGDGSSGQVEFNFTGGVLDVPAGMYEGEIIVVESGLEQRVYDTLRFRVRERFGELG
jgi:hypothetical protein